MRILLIHGVGHSEQDEHYYAPWETAITTGLSEAGFDEPVEYREFRYDDLFDSHYSGPGTYAAAFTELVGSAAYHSIVDPVSGVISNIFHRSRDFAYGGDSFRWHVGMVAQLVVEGALRRDLHNRLAKELTDNPPDLVAAHSLGSLLSFDFLRNDSRAAQFGEFDYLTFGSQINNPFVRSELYPGRLIMPKPLRSWTHLYNPKDPVLTADIRLADQPAFRHFQTESAAGHSPVTTTDGPGYLDHPITKQLVWPALAHAGSQRVAHVFKRALGVSVQAMAKPRRRALLIGINAYPDPANRLEGCVNDTYLMSAALQERGFDAEDIRVVLDDRATADAIRERIHWLLDDVGDGMERVLFYSGHGAQLPVYDPTGVVDHVDECLVPYDFAWTRETAVTDKDFYRLYSDLPFSAKFFAIFDCCHSGGLTRDGNRKIRGISPPDDIRHRRLRWNAAEHMWEERPLEGQLNPHFGGKAGDRVRMMGQNGATYRFGRGMALRRTMSQAKHRALADDGLGLYLPVLLEACREDQLSYEYRDGATSYGAFTYSLVKNLRAKPDSTFQNLIVRTTHTLQTLQYDQEPQLVGPSTVISRAIPGT